MLFVGDSRTRQLVIGLLVLVEQVLPKLVRSQDGGGGARAWATLAEEAESDVSFLGPEWKVSVLIACICGSTNACMNVCLYPYLYECLMPA